MRRGLRLGAGVALLSFCGCTTDRDTHSAPLEGGADGARDVAVIGEDRGPSVAEGDREASCGDACDAGTELDGGVSALEAVENPANVLSYYVSWRTASPVRTVLAVDCGPGYRRAFEGDALATDHEVFVLGLFGGAHCTFTAGDASRVSDAGDAGDTVDAGPVRSIAVDVRSPPGLPALTVVVPAGEHTEPGFTLLNLSKEAEPKQPGIAALIDSEGRYRWYYQRSSYPGPDDDVQLVPEGVLIGSRLPAGPMIVDWEGKVVWNGGFEMHHSIVPTGAGQFLYLYDSPTGCPKRPAGVVARWDRARSEKIWEWRLCEHFLPPVEEAEWSHLNHIELYPDGSAFLISSRNQSQIYKVSFSTEKVEWALGGVAGPDYSEGGDFVLAKEDRFITQHAPKLLPAGRLLLFDNGIIGLRPWSRGLELEIDEKAKTARAVWQFRPEPDIYSAVWGDADRLPGGGTLMTFGQRLADQGSRLIESGPDGKTVVWHVVTPVEWGIYRSERVVMPAFGRVLR